MTQTIGRKLKIKPMSLVWYYKVFTLNSRHNTATVYCYHDVCH